MLLRDVTGLGVLQGSGNGADAAVARDCCACCMRCRRPWHAAGRQECCGCRRGNRAVPGGAGPAGGLGFLRKRNTGQAAFVLRTLQEQHWRGKQQLWACFFDLKQAYDRVPRQLLWEKLEARGLGASGCKL